MKTKKIVIIGAKNSFNKVFPILNGKKYKVTNVIDDNKAYYKKKF